VSENSNASDAETVDAVINMDDDEIPLSDCSPITR
jgi:hypothetical protein